MSNPASGRNEKSTCLNPGLAIRWTAAILVSGTAAWLAIRNIDWGELRALLANASPSLVALGLVAVLATSSIKAARWQMLLRHSGTRVGWWRVFRVLVVGQMGNSFLPARLGDIARAALVSPLANEGAPAAFGTVIAEKLLDAAVGLIAALGIAAVSEVPGWLQRPLLTMALGVAALVLLIAVAVTGRRGLPAAARPGTPSMPTRRRMEACVLTARWSQLGKWTSQFRHGLLALATPPALLGGVGMSIAIWVLGAATNHIILSASGTTVPLWANFLVLVAVYAATFLPAVPAQIGVFEYACVLALGTVGVAVDRALAFGLLLHLVVYAPPAFLGPAFTALEAMSRHKLGSGRNANRNG